MQRPKASASFLCHFPCMPNRVAGFSPTFVTTSHNVVLLISHDETVKQNHMVARETVKQFNKVI